MKKILLTMIATIGLNTKAEMIYKLTTKFDNQEKVFNDILVLDKKPECSPLFTEMPISGSITSPGLFSKKIENDSYFVSQLVSFSTGPQSDFYLKLKIDEGAGEKIYLYQLQNNVQFGEDYRKCFYNLFEGNISDFSTNEQLGTVKAELISETE